MIISTINNELPLSILSMERGHGSFITIDLASKINSLTKYHLWIYLTDWYFLDLKDNNILLTSELVEEIHNEKFFKEFISSQMKSVVFKNKKVIEFLFSNETVLVLEANLDEYELDDEMFFFFKDSIEVISYSIKNGITYENPKEALFKRRDFLG